MSMRDYAIEEYGMVFNNSMLDFITKQLECESKYDVVEALDLRIESEFNGEVISIDDDGKEKYEKGISYDNEEIIYASLYHWSTLFHSAYNNIDEIVDELRERFGEYLPDDFDYRKNIQHIIGTYFG